jgi:hypothetical protein
MNDFGQVPMAFLEALLGGPAVALQELPLADIELRLAALFQFLRRAWPLDHAARDKTRTRIGGQSRLFMRRCGFRQVRHRISRLAPLRPRYLPWQRSRWRALGIFVIIGVRRRALARTLLLCAASLVEAAARLRGGLILSWLEKDSSKDYIAMRRKPRRID